MRKHNDWPIGICTWSLHNSFDDISALFGELGLEHVHLAAGPATEPGGEAYLDEVRARGWTVTSTMIGFAGEDYSTLAAIRRTGGVAPDDAWEANRDQVIKALDATVALGVPHLSMHAGFIDPRDPAYARKFHERIRCLADAAGERGVMLLMETGQESAAELRDFLETLDHPALGINFDPANMILYDKDDPVTAVRILGPWIKHIHIKDAIRTTVPGEWGSEVPWGDGDVDGPAFFEALADAGFNGALAIEREAGDARLDDIRLAVSRL